MLDKHSEDATDNQLLKELNISASEGTVKDAIVLAFYLLLRLSSEKPITFE